MANSNPSPTSRFKKGNPGGGRPKNQLRTDDVKRIVGKLWRAKRAEIKGILTDENASMGDLMIASVMTKIVKDGDANKLNMLLDRTIGKPRSDIHLEVEDKGRKIEDALVKDAVKDPDVFNAMRILAARAAQHQLEQDDVPKPGE